MTVSAAISNRFSNANISLNIRFFTLIIMTIFADWLFYGHDVGISLALFLLVLGVTFLALNFKKIEKSRLFISIIILLLAIMPISEEFNALSGVFAISGIMLFVIYSNKHFSKRLSVNIDHVLQLTLLSIGRIFEDIGLNMRVSSRKYQEQKKSIGITVLLTNWVLPIAFTFVFLILFMTANPIISRWVNQLQFDLENSIPDISGFRVVFWIVTAIVIWPLLRLRLRIPPSLNKYYKSSNIEISYDYPVSDTGNDLISKLFNRQSVTRSLILFNLLFAVQSFLDITYLWQSTVPEGMTYANYAHKGAYPLIATALLAGFFVLVALRPGSSTEGSKLIRSLVYIWILQNVLLVASTIFRLNLYVSVYHLTYLRVAALVWMGLIIVGLVLIVLRIFLKKSNTWLIYGNLASLIITLYACCYINFGHIIATYNTSSDRLETLDVKYLCSLGESALPSFKKIIESEKFVMKHNQHILIYCYRSMTQSFHSRNYNWRSWSARRHRLTHYLNGSKNATPTKISK